ncbi:hypothetical protein BCR37DRAFT_386731 [Protomyces lactucae-debilis]|uniref:Uncharacterized protein n=1 Tax=Protomyces lactucae-debilis TaxID=2754530 RepID=A0A1Y2FIC0_PROLT|nr:uncharacterized protein BCR37DRAFT_386731 [Protomyces lactucae-debilis]ORY83700.1 hypothetical protein BCR37DRAFT_386731 [Protomyces lactucae-debilis]
MCQYTTAAAPRQLPFPHLYQLTGDMSWDIVLYNKTYTAEKLPSCGAEAASCVCQLSVALHRTMKETIAPGSLFGSSSGDLTAQHGASTSTQDSCILNNIVNRFELQVTSWRAQHDDQRTQFSYTDIPCDYWSNPYVYKVEEKELCIIKYQRQSDSDGIFVEGTVKWINQDWSVRSEDKFQVRPSLLTSVVVPETAETVPMDIDEWTPYSYT